MSILPYQGIGSLGWNLERFRKSGKIYFAQNSSFRDVHFQIDSNSKWDSSLLVFLLKAREELSEKNLAVDFSSLPEKMQNLLSFAQDRSTTEET